MATSMLPVRYAASSKILTLARQAHQCPIQRRRPRGQTTNHGYSTVVAQVNLWIMGTQMPCQINRILNLYFWISDPRCQYIQKTLQIFKTYETFQDYSGFDGEMENRPRIVSDDRHFIFSISTQPTRRSVIPTACWRNDEDETQHW